jgi:hypothetical protein
MLARCSARVEHGPAGATERRTRVARVGRRIL